MGCHRPTLRSIPGPMLRGEINISNLAPPEGTHLTSVVPESPPSAAPPRTDGPDDAARRLEMQALADRVRQLEFEAQFAQRSAPPGRDLSGAPDATVLGILGIPARLCGGPRSRLRSFMGGLRQLVDAIWIPRSDSRRAGTGLSPRAPHPWRPQRADTAPDAPFRGRLPIAGARRCRPQLSRISLAESLRRARPLPSDRDRCASFRRAARTCRPWAPIPVSAANPQSRATSAACSSRR